LGRGHLLRRSARNVAVAERAVRAVAGAAAPSAAACAAACCYCAYVRLALKMHTCSTERCSTGKASKHVSSSIGLS